MQRRLSMAAKREIMERYWREKDQDAGLSIREFSGRNGIRYYTFRDWYRSPEVNGRWDRRHEYTAEGAARISGRAAVTSDAGGRLVRIGGSDAL